MNDYDADELLHRTDRLLTSFDLSPSETEEVRRLKEDLELPDNEIDLADAAQKLAFHERRATSRPATVPLISLHIEHDPTERGLTVPEGSRVLIARRRGKVFETPSSGELFDGDGEERPEGFVVILPPDGVARPVWRFAGGEATALRAGLSADNWSLRAAHAAEGHVALEEVMRSFTNEQGRAVEQARAVFRSMTRAELDEETGGEYTGSASLAMGEEVLERFRAGLERERIQLKKVPAKDTGPCEWPHAELILSDSDKPQTTDGWKVPLANCGQLHKDVLKGVSSKYDSLYLHQLLTLKQMKRCRSSNTPFEVVLSTPTASGKTMAFLPAILSDLADNDGNALFLYPLRALCNDQVGKIRDLLHAMGRTGEELHPFYDQAALPKKAFRLIAATPDKINVHLDKAVIQHFLRGLRWLVIDEAHTYKGCFGINVAFLLRRLLYFADRETRLVLSSATLDNTVTFARKLTGRSNFRVVSGSAAPRHARYYYLAKSETKTTLRAIVDRALENTSKGLIFVLGRGVTQQRATTLGRGIRKGVVFPFYSGVKDYPELLKRLNDNGAAVAVATSSLEAGVDIVDVTDLAICGFPRSRGSFIQMAGRAGRQGTGHVVFIPGNTLADEFYSYPAAFRELIGSDAEPIYLNPLNRPLMETHLKRFAREAPNTEMAKLLDAFLPPGTPTELRSALEATLAECSDEVPPPGPPSLRAIPGDVHVVLETGANGQPLPPLDHLKRSDAEKRKCLIEVAIQENARREWAPESIATRDGRYFRVERWDRGKWIEDGGENAGRATDAVFIWVRNITDDMLGPEDYRDALAGKISLPEGKEAEHYHQAVLGTTGRIERVTNRGESRGLNVEAGRGTVNVAVQSFRLRWQLEVRYRCPRWSSRLRGEKAERLSADVVEWFLDGRPIKAPRSDTGEVFAAMRSFEAKIDGRVRRFRVIERRVVAQILRIDLEEHVFDSAQPAPCSCGSPLVLDFGWTRAIEESPPSWWKHSVYLTDRRFESDLAVIRFPKAKPEAILALAYALVKVMPGVMFLDPGDVGAALIRHEVGVALLLYDVIEGGSGICTDVPVKFAELVSAAERLLRRCPECLHCQGAGCFGCLQPREPLDWPRPEPPPGETGRQDTEYIPWPACALEVLTGRQPENSPAEGGTP